MAARAPLVCDGDEPRESAEGSTRAQEREKNRAKQGSRFIRV